MNTKFSIVIPVRNSINTLKHTIRTCLAQSYNNYEIIIHDNCSEDDILSLIEEFDCEKIKYYKTSSIIPMTYNFRYALEKVTGDYVIYLGADDGLHSYALEVLNKVIDITHSKVITWEWDLYKWRDSFYDDKNKLHLWNNRNTTMNIAEKELKRVMNFNVGYTPLPILYIKTAVSTPLIDDIKNNGMEIFDSICPDVYSGMVLATNISEYLNLGISLSFAGLSGNSNGSGNLFKPETKKAKEYWVLNSQYKLEFKSIIKNSALLRKALSTVAIEDSFRYLLNNSSNIDENLLNYKLEIEGILNECLSNSNEINYNVIDNIIEEIQNVILDDEKIKQPSLVEWFEKEIVDKKIRIMENAVRLKNDAKGYRYFNDSYIEINTKELDVYNIYDAMVFSEKILDYERIISNEINYIYNNFHIKTQEEKKQKINKIITNICADAESIGICGSGDYGKVLYKEIKKKLTCDNKKIDVYFFDSNKEIIGTKIEEVCVYGYDCINQIKPSKLVIASYRSQEEIFGKLINIIKYEPQIVKLHENNEKPYLDILIR